MIETLLSTEAFDTRTQEALVLSLFESLREGEGFVVHSRADPELLCKKLDTLAQPNLSWEFAERQPGNWRLRIRKKKSEELNNSGGCCGMCGG